MRLDPGTIGASGWLFLLFMGGYIPWKAWRAGARFDQSAALPSRPAFYASAIVSLAVLLPIALVIGFMHHMELFPRAWPTAVGWLQAAFTLVAMLLPVWPRWRSAVARGDRRIFLFMPSGAKEQGLWVALSGMAALVEETAYRGVMFSLLLWTTGNVAFAAVLAAGLHGLAHAFQDRLAMGIVFLYGLLLQLLALQSGSLYLPILVHFLFDVIAGFTYARLGREAGGLGLPPAIDTPAATESSAGGPR
jgi:membrane protease YdiL (CAAX protease family)